jgi:uncharacterized protein
MFLYLHFENVAGILQKNISILPWCFGYKYLKYYGVLDKFIHFTTVFWNFLYFCQKSMKRLFETYLDAWQSNPNRKPLVIRGARQVGKTWLVDQLGKKAFKYYLKLNPEKNPNLKAVFKHNDPRLIINELTAIFNIPVTDGETLLFIDEVQLLPEALAALRYFYEEMPGLHVIAAGSLLDHTLNEMSYSMPVGRVEFAYLYPMNFAEFLMAGGQEGLVNYLGNYKLGEPFGEALHEQVKTWLRLYYFIGGMPAAVKVYCDTGNLLAVEKEQNAIITSFKYDFSKYGTKKQQELLNQCMVYAALHIGQKVKYANINKSEHSNYLKDAFKKLELSRIVHLVRRTGSSKVPINQFVDEDVFKPLFLDIGLACNLAGIKLTDIQNLVTDFEGALAEQFVGQELLAGFEHFEDGRLYYWAREKKNASAEIDFLHQIGNKIYPIEVKAGKTGMLKSLQVYLGEKDQQTGVRFNMDLPNVGENLTASINIKSEYRQIVYTLISCPLFLAGFIKQVMHRAD